MLKNIPTHFFGLQNFCQFKKKSDFCTRFFTKKAPLNNVNKQKKL